MLKSRRLVRLVTVALALIAGFLLVGCDDEVHWNPVIPNHTTHVEYEEFTPATAGVSSIEASTANGSVVIDAGPRNRVWVRARKEVRASEASEARRIAGLIRVHVYREGGTIRVLSDLPEVHSGVQIEVSYEIECPGGWKTGLHTWNGEIRIHGSPAWVLARAGNGRILADLDELSGSGEFRVGNGSVQAVIGEGNPSVRVEAVNGPVQLSLPGDYSGGMDLQATSGTVRCDLPLTRVVHRGARRIVGELGNGGAAEVIARVVNGSIRVGRAD